MRHHTRTTLLTTALALALVAGPAVTASADDATPPVPMGVATTYANTEGWDLEDIQDDTAEVVFTEIVFEVDRGEETVVVGVLTEGDDTADSITAEVAATLSDLASKDTSSEPSARRALNQLATTAVDEWKVIAVTAPADIDVPDTIVVDATSITSSQGIPDADVVVDEPSKTARASKCGDTWKPNTVTLNGGYSSTSKSRYAKVEFKWTSSTRLANLKACPAVTLEPDFVTYNYDGKNYLAKMRSWSTNMPSQYVYFDTSFLDSVDEPVYTVGLSDATKLKLNTNYYTYIRTTNGNANTDKAKIIVQRGKKTVPGCSSLWCIYSQSSQRYPSGTGWVTIPGSKKWTS